MKKKKGWLKMFLWIAFLIGLVGALPLILSRAYRAATVMGLMAWPLSWWLLYASTPSFVWPLGGIVGGLLLGWWIICFIVACNLDYSYGESSHRAIIPPIAGLLIYAICWIPSWNMFNAGNYAKLIGNVKIREWTKDVQPKDPRHVRLVPKELAFYLATKQLGEAPGAIGSQFQVSEEHLTLQMVNGELWYISPLDYRGLASWTATKGAPGYVMVHGEDPRQQVIVKVGNKFQYTTGAWFGKNLERHLRSNGYSFKGLTDFSFEIDDNGHPWWVVTVFHPTKRWSGKRVDGVVVIDPTTGQDEFFPHGSVPNWVDRVVPEDFVKEYIKLYGKYSDGWWNGFWSGKNLVKPEEPSIIYGTDGNPYWVTDLTSTNDKDDSLTGLVYTNSRTGESIRYHAIGGTDSAVLNLVNNKVAYRKLHGSSPVLYNIYGVMTAIVPLLGESHTYMGVAMVDVANMQVADHEQINYALAAYKKLTSSAQQLAPDKTSDEKRMRGTIDRFAVESVGADIYFYLHLDGVPHIFFGGNDLSPKLRLSRAGDTVSISVIDSGESVIPLLSFDNESLVIRSSPAEQELTSRTQVRKIQQGVEQDTRSLRNQLENMSDEDLMKIMRSHK